MSWKGFERKYARLLYINVEVKPACGCWSAKFSTLKYNNKQQPQRSVLTIELPEIVTTNWIALISNHNNDNKKKLLWFFGEQYQKYWPLFYYYIFLYTRLIYYIKELEHISNNCWYFRICIIILNFDNLEFILIVD